MKNSFIKLLGVLAFAGSALVSQAVPFANGSFISFTNANNTGWTGSGGTDVFTYTGISSFGQVAVNLSTGSFTATAPANTAVAMATPLSFANPFANPPLWATGGFTFVLSSFATPLRLSADPANGRFFDQLILNGSGFVSGNGFEGVGDWTWSGDAQGSQTFSFSSATIVRAPDGGLTIALLGASLIALAGLRRKFQS